MAIDGIRRLAVIPLVAILAASVSLVASPSVIPLKAAAVSCFVTPVSAPVRVTGPAVKATGEDRCDTSVYNLQVRVQIYARDCGTCHAYLFANGGLVNCFNCSINKRSVQSFCSGTRSYYAAVDGYFSVDGGTYIYIGPPRLSWVATISC
jgi:hypothetical protein